MPVREPNTPFRLSAGDLPQSEAEARLEQQIVESYLARIEQNLEARVDQQVEARLRDASARRSITGNFTTRLAASLAIGIPLTAVAGGIASQHGNGNAATVAIGAVLALIFGLNVYYTEAEKDLEKERLRRLP